MKRIIWVMALFLACALTAPMAMAQKVEPNKTESGPDSAQKPAETKQIQPERAPSFFKVEIALHELEGGKRVNTRNYTVTTDDSNRGFMKTDSRISVPQTSTSTGAVMSYTSMDIGLSINCRIRQIASSLWMDSDINWSSLAPPEQGAGIPTQPMPVTRRLQTYSVTEVILGKTVLLSSVDDSVSKRQYQVEVKVTKQ